MSSGPVTDPKAAGGKVRPPRIVAELGRPETPEETAARKAEDSRKYRANKTVNNLWLSLITTVGVVILIVLIVPRGDAPPVQSFDYAALAQEAQGAVDTPLLVPDLPKGWTSNNAELSTDTPDKIDVWYIGLLTPSNDYLGFSEGLAANPSWLLTTLEGSISSSTEDIGGYTWAVYDNTAKPGQHGNVDYALSTSIDDNYYVVYGTAPAADAKTLAKALAAELDAKGSTP